MKIVLDLDDVLELTLSAFIADGSRVPKALAGKPLEAIYRFDDQTREFVGIDISIMDDDDEHSGLPIEEKGAHTISRP